MSHSLPTLHSLHPFFIFVGSMAAFCPHRKIPALSLETSWWTLSFPRSAKSLSLPLLETSDGKQHAERTSQVRALHADTLVVEACWSLSVEKKRWNQSSWLNKIELFDKLQHDLCCVCGGWRWQIYVYVLQYVSICYYAVYILSNISKKFRWHHQVKRRLQRHSWAVHGCCATCALDHTEDAAGSSFGKMVRKLWWDDTLWHIISQVLGDSFVGEWLCTRDLRVFVKGYITLADSMGIDDQWHCLWSDNQHPGFWSVQSVILWEGKWLLRVDGSFRHTLQTKLRPSLHGEWCEKKTASFTWCFTAQPLRFAALVACFMGATDGLSLGTGSLDPMADACCNVPLWVWPSTNWD